QIACSDRNLAQNTEIPGERSRVMVEARLGEVAACGDAELDAQMLKQDCHQIGNHDHTTKRVAEPCASGQIGRPVARIHTAHGDQESRTGKSHELPPKGRRLWHKNGAMDLWQGNLTAGPSPGGARSCCGYYFRLRHECCSTDS